MKYLLHLIFIILIALVTFFGLGPVLIADGTAGERVLTGIVVVVIYIVLGIGYWIAVRWANRR